MMIRRGVALALVWLAVAAPAVMAQSLETPPDPLVRGSILTGEGRRRTTG